MFSLKRVGLMLPAILFAAFFFGPQQVRADNVVVTDGGLSRGRTLDVSFGFSGEGLSFIGHGESTAVFCSSCPGGSVVNASMPFVFENSGGPTINGIHYQRVFYTGSIFLNGSPITIPLNDTTPPFDASAAFTMSGNVMMYLNDPSLGDPGPPVFSSTLSGQGIVTLHLQTSVSAPGQIYNQVGVSYNFQPNEVPEPATLLLLGSSLTGLAVRARRKRNGKD